VFVLSARSAERTNTNNEKYRFRRGSRKDEGVRKLALELIETEADSKYRKKYATLWRRR
jgi:hypothetical protein